MPLRCPWLVQMEWSWEFVDSNMGVLGVSWSGQINGSIRFDPTSTQRMQFIILNAEHQQWAQHVEVLNCTARVAFNVLSKGGPLSSTCIESCSRDQIKMESLRSCYHDDDSSTQSCIDIYVWPSETGCVLWILDELNDGKLSMSDWTMKKTFLIRCKKQNSDKVLWYVPWHNNFTISNNKRVVFDQNINQIDWDSS